MVDCYDITYLRHYAIDKVLIMSAYTPRIHHAILTLFLSIALFALSDNRTGNIYGALLFGSGSFFIMAASIVWMMALSHHYYVTIQYIEAYIKLDPVQRSELGFNIPSLRFTVRRGKVSELFEDTRASIEHMRLFLVDSNSINTAAERNWNTAERPRWAWAEIYDWCVRNGKVRDDSAAGSHSYEWVGNSYNALMFYWLRSNVPNLDEPVTPPPLT